MFISLFSSPDSNATKICPIHALEVNLQAFVPAIENRSNNLHTSFSWLEIPGNWLFTTVRGPFINKHFQVIYVHIRGLQ